MPPRPLPRLQSALVSSAAAELQKDIKDDRDDDKDDKDDNDKDDKDD